MGKKLLVISTLALILCLLLSACSASENLGNDQNDHYNNNGGFEIGEDNEIDSENPVNVQKLIKTVFIDLETLNYNETISAVKSRCSFYNGYIQESVEKGKNLYSDSLRTAEIIIRIPSEKLNDFLDDVTLLGNVLQTVVNTEDVTDAYFDIETRLEALNIKKSTYMALLDETKEISEIVSLTDALSDVIYEIESLTTKLNKYDSLVEYSTVTIKIIEVEELDPNVEIGFIDEIKDTFISSVESLINLLKGLFICAVALIPFMSIPLLILGLILIISKIKKKNNKK